MRLCFVALTLFLIGAASVVHADPLAEVYPTVRIYGRTHIEPQVITRLAGLPDKPDMQASEIKARLMNTNLFSYVRVERTHEHVWIRLHDKTTWFAVPFFSKDAGHTTIAIAAGKSALFGEDMTALTDVQFGGGDFKADLLVRDTAVDGTPLILQINPSTEESHWRVFNGRDVVTRTLNKAGGTSFRTGFHLSPYFSLFVDHYVEHHTFEELSGNVQGGFQLSHKLSFRLSDFYENEGLTEGQSVELYYERTSPPSHFQFSKYGANIRYTVYQDAPLNWSITAKAERGVFLPRYQLFTLGGPSLRGFPSEEFRGNLYGAIQNDVSLAKLDAWSLRLRPFIFGDWAYINGSGRPATGAGIKFYVKTVSISAFQFYGGYGFNPTGLSLSVAVGTRLD